MEHNGGNTTRSVMWKLCGMNLMNPETKKLVQEFTERLAFLRDSL